MSTRSVTITLTPREALTIHFLLAERQIDKVEDTDTAALRRIAAKINDAKVGRKSYA